MTQKYVELTTVKFVGPRFDDHGLDIDVLQELITYKQLLAETATELWRRGHPGRERLPKGYKSAEILRVFRLIEGSVAVPIMRLIPEGIFPEFYKDEWDVAAELLENTIMAADIDRSLPENLPRSVLAGFSELMKTLRASESMYIGKSMSKAEAHLTHEVRDRLLSWQSKTYEDIVDLKGEVRFADLDANSFAVRLANGIKISGKFAPQQEREIVEALHEHGSQHLRVRGMGEFAVDDRTLRRVTHISELMIERPDERAAVEDAHPIWDEVAEIGESVSIREWSHLPTDLSKTYRRRLYGERWRRE